jgi:hypothetical protein
MLVGESAVLEALLYEEFDRAFPKMHTFQGALSAATLDDLLISLGYVEKVYGRDAVPRVLVLGISPRFVANFPEGRFFLRAIQLYSPYFGVEETPAGPRLVPKTFWQGWLSWLRFVLFKQQKRYLASLTVLARNLVSVNSTESVPKLLAPQGELLRSVTMHPLEALRQISRVAVVACYAWWASPYKYHDLPPTPVKIVLGYLRDPESVLRKVQSWNPETSRQMLADRFRRFKDFTEKRKIHLYVFSVPERPESRRLYDERNYQRYVTLVKENLGDTPYLDLREMLHPWEFNDVAHASMPGAKRVTERVIRFIREPRDGAPELAD